MAINEISHQEQAYDGWAERHPVASAAMATLVTGALTVGCAIELAERPTVGRALGTSALALITASGAVETLRPDTFRLWERMETWLNKD